MRRRDLLAGLSWTVLGPTVVSAQERVSFTIGFLHAASQGPNARSVAAFVSGLQDMGLSEGKSIFVEYRWAEGQYDRLPTLVSDLITRKVAVIVASGGTAPAHAAKLATQTIPIVFISGDDPIRLGLVKSFNRPEGNLTGVVFFNSALAGKRVELLHEIMPSADTIAYLTNPESPNAASEARDVEDAANKLNINLHMIQTTNRGDLHEVFLGLPNSVKGVLVAADPVLGADREQICSLSTGLKLPVIGPTREFVLSGAVATYTTSLTDAYHKAGVYAGRILRGVTPSDLPIEQPTKFELVINSKAAENFGISIPATVLARTDEVIE